MNIHVNFHVDQAIGYFAAAFLILKIIQEVRKWKRSA